MSQVVVAFYKFVHLPDFAELRAPLVRMCAAHHVVGTVILAAEGINATISGARAGIESVLGHLRADARLADLEHKESTAGHAVFKRMKVRLKKEIVTLGVAGTNPLRRVGNYVDPQQWNALIAAPDVTLIDTRNAYETRIGTFAGALDPQLENFRQFPAFIRAHLDPQRHPKVALFCTGGIRCEKATSFLLDQGFPEVYHLRGGILKYLEQVPQAQSLWQGKCFVFDERVAVQHGDQAIRIEALE